MHIIVVHGGNHLKIKKWSPTETAETTVGEKGMCSESSIWVPKSFPSLWATEAVLLKLAAVGFLSFTFLRDLTSLPTAHCYWCPPWTLDICVEMISSDVPQPCYNLWSRSIFLALSHFVIWAWKAAQLVFHVSEFLMKTPLASAAASLLTGCICEERPLFFSQNLLDKPSHVPFYQLLRQSCIHLSPGPAVGSVLFPPWNKCPLVYVSHLFSFISLLSGSPCHSSL